MWSSSHLCCQLASYMLQPQPPLVLKWSYSAGSEPNSFQLEICLGLILPSPFVLCGPCARLNFTCLTTKGISKQSHFTDRTMYQLLFSLLLQNTQRKQAKEERAYFGSWFKAGKVWQWEQFELLTLCTLSERYECWFLLFTWSGTIAHGTPLPTSRVSLPIQLNQED